MNEPSVPPHPPRPGEPAAGDPSGPGAPQTGGPGPAAPRAVDRAAAVRDRVDGELRRLFVGQDELVTGAIVALFAGGHVLIEGVPGLGKTLFVRALGRILGCDFRRVQFTPDLMPSDLTGTMVFSPDTRTFRLRRGPVFTHILLADEINRSPAKTHAALLEILQERQVTIDTETLPVEAPFLCLATENPVESEGTYALPEAQLDRFLMQLRLAYPAEAEELEILALHGRGVDPALQVEETLEAVTGPEEVLEVQRICGAVRVERSVLDYINRIVRATRDWPGIGLGASPRAGLALLRSARTFAALEGRDFAVPDDIARFVLPVLRHRIFLTPEAEVEGRQVDEELSRLLAAVEVPRGGEGASAPEGR